MRYKILLIILTIVVLITLGFVSPAKAQTQEVTIPTIEKPISEMTIEELQAKITEILAAVQQLQALLLQLTGEAPDISRIPSDFTFQTNLKPGQSSIDVKYLQIFLNSNPDTQLAQSGAGSPGNETMYFGPRTKEALIKFQEKYQQDVLSPWYLTKGTGYVGQTTRTKINELLQQYRAGVTPGEQEEEEEEEPTPTPTPEPEPEPEPEPTNNLPVLNPIGNKSVTEEETLTFTITATDPDGDELSYFIQNRPSGATFSNQTFTWTPFYTQSGTYNVTFIVSDSEYTDEETITITVEVGIPTTSQISQFGITWTFDQNYPYGQFANGDYWVVGPVIITSITPDFDGSHHGWQSNPVPGSAQGFDSRISGFNAGLVPGLPYTASVGESIVKSISLEPLGSSCMPCLETAAVLTVLAAAPPDNGATVFRPPYVASWKPFYSTNLLRTGLLPSLDRTPNAPSLTTVKNYFQRVQLDHKLGCIGRYMHPETSMPDYGSDIATRTAVGALGLMFNDPIEEKMSALINYVQMGIDFYGILKAGGSWNGDGGHMEGRKLPITFAAVFLDNQEMRDAVSNASDSQFGENKGIDYSERAGRPIFAQINCPLTMYWGKLYDHSRSGSKTCKDPYGYIDGGQTPGVSYLGCCLAKNWKFSSLAVRLIPELRTVWNDEDFHDFVDRYVDFGIWTQPDPCAPPDGSGCCQGPPNDNYGVTFGPDPNNLGECIYDTDSSDGIGRRPDLHGTNKDFGYHGSGFGDEMWTAYRNYQSSSARIDSKSFINNLASVLSAIQDILKKIQSLF